MQPGVVTFTRCSVAELDSTHHCFRTGGLRPRAGALHRRQAYWRLRAAFFDRVRSFAAEEAIRRDRIHSCRAAARWICADGFTRGRGDRFSRGRRRELGDTRGESEGWIRPERNDSVRSQTDPGIEVV